jgi:beta-galactosidase/beta-glucuronidase
VVGEHDGGYTAFEIDISKQVADEIEIVVKVVDRLMENGAAYGKQREDRGGIWYTSTSGIWQTVWIESVPETYLKNVKITPKYDESSVEFIPEVVGKSDAKGNVIVFDAEGKEVASGELVANKPTTLKINDFMSWSPETPYLYKLKYEYGKDTVESYFAMRKYSVGKDEKGIMRLLLNNKPYFHNGLLDQGYWSDGYYTAPSDEALKYDIQKMKDLGFNMLRKHIKIEPLRWYYHCDTIGMLVWQDAVSGGTPYHPLLIQILPLVLGVDYVTDKYYSIYGRSCEIGRKNYYRDLKAMVEHLYNVPSIAVWVPFNEGWGQFDAAKAVDFIKELDVTRSIDHASGWHDQGAGDFKSLHVYFKKVRIKPDAKGRAIILSEFGGYSHGVKGHVGSTTEFGYATYKTVEDFNNAFKKLYFTEIIPQIPTGLSATVYTQVSDVEDEVNGLLTYDRKVCKADEKVFRDIMSNLKY